MMKKYIVVLFLGSFLQADILFTENFDDDGVWPTGWTFDEYINPETGEVYTCLLYTSPSPRDRQKSRMPSSA